MFSTETLTGFRFLVRMACVCVWYMNSLLIFVSYLDGDEPDAGSGAAAAFGSLSSDEGVGGATAQGPSNTTAGGGIETRGD